MKLVRATLEHIVVPRPQPSEAQPQGMCLDKGYDYDEVRAIMAEFGCTAHIRARGEEAHAIKNEAGGHSAPLGGGAGAFLAQSLPPLAYALGQERRQLPRLPAFRLWADRVSGRRVIRIGTKFEMDSQGQILLHQPTVAILTTCLRISRMHH